MGFLSNLPLVIFGSERVKNACFRVRVGLFRIRVRVSANPNPNPNPKTAVCDFSTAVATVETGLSLWTCSRKEKREICVFRKKFSLLSALDYG